MISGEEAERKSLWMHFEAQWKASGKRKFCEWKKKIFFNYVESNAVDLGIQVEIVDYK